MNLETGRVIERIIIVLCIPILIIVGYKLFVLGVTGKMEITAKMSAASAKITSVAPGGLCFVLAVSLGAYSLFSKLTETKSATRSESLNQSYDPPPTIDPTNPQPASVSKGGEVKNSLPATGQRIYKKVITENVESKTSDLGPNLHASAGPTLSYRLRVALDNLYFCNAGSKDDVGYEACRKSFDQQFKLMPSANDIAEIEKAETEMSSSQVDVQKRGQEDYSREVRTFVR